MALYTKPYFYKRRVSRYDVPQLIIAGAWFGLWQPFRVFDMGCGIGSYLAAFRQLGCRIKGCDIGQRVAAPFMRAYVRKRTFRWDATRPIPYQRKADLTICLDVAEHLPAEGHTVMWANLVRVTKPGGRVLFTGGTPGQPGCGHISCQSRAKWVDDGDLAGLVYDHESTEQAWKALDALRDPLGFRNRVIVFRRPE